MFLLEKELKKLRCQHCSFVFLLVLILGFLYRLHFVDFPSVKIRTRWELSFQPIMSRGMVNRKHVKSRSLKCLKKWTGRLPLVWCCISLVKQYTMFIVKLIITNLQIIIQHIFLDFLTPIIENMFLFCCISVPVILGVYSKLYFY